MLVAEALHVTPADVRAMPISDFEDFLAFLHWKGDQNKKAMSDAKKGGGSTSGGRQMMPARRVPRQRPK